MTTPRRRIIRPVAAPPPVSQRLTRLRTKLAREQRLLAGWLVRMKRSFNGFDKYQRRVTRLEREIGTLEQPHVPRD